MSIPIITYHAIGEAASPVFTSPAAFASHMDALASAGYRTISLATLIEGLQGRASLPEKPVVLSFDDGYESVYRLAWPAMRQRGFSGTVFLISDYCGRDNRWPGQPESIPTAPLLSWEQAGELAASGWEPGAHTRTHPPLPTLAPAQAEDEINASQQAIQARTGQPSRVFAYPYGAVNATVRQIVERSFDGAASTSLGLTQPGSDPYALERIDSFYLTPGWIARMDQPVFRRYLALRRMLRAVRRIVRPDWR